MGSSTVVSSGGGFSIGSASRSQEVAPSSGGEFALRGGLFPRLLSGSDFDPQPDPPKPDHWWSGDDRARDLVGEAHGIEVGGLTHAPGLVGTAFQFNGKDAAIRFGPDVGNFGTNDFSVEFLVKSSSKGNAPFLLKRVECNWGNILEIDDSTATLVENRFQKNWVDIPYGRSLNDGDWHHLALTRAGTAVAFYVDGSPVFNRAFDFITAISNSVDLVAGLSPCPQHTGVSPLQGMMDEIKIYERRALTPRQVAAAARAVKTLRIGQQPRGATFAVPSDSHTLEVGAVTTAPPPLYGTLSYQWFFDGAPIEGATRSTHVVRPVDSHTMGRYVVAVNDGVTTVYSEPADLLVQSFDLPRPAHWWPLDGNLVDAVTGETGSASNGTYFATGRLGAAFDFRGPNYLDLGSQAGNMGTNDFSATLWLRASSSVVSPTLLSWKTNCGAASYWRVGLFAPELSVSTPEMAYVGSNRTGVDAAPAGQGRPYDVKDGRWHHLAFVRQGTNAFVYRDGIRVATARDQAVASLPVKGRLLAGVDPCNVRDASGSDPVNNANPLIGLLDDIKIYPVALVGAEIAAEMRRAPAILANPVLVPHLAVDGALSPTRFKWLIEPGAGQALAQADVDGIDLESSFDLRLWTVVPGAVRLVNGHVEIVDIEAFSKRESFYRIARRDPANAAAPIGGEVPVANVEQSVLTAAMRHLATFIASTGPTDPDRELWSDVTVGPTARFLYDPGYRNGAEPAFLELKLITRAGREDRGYLMLSVTEGTPEVVEFAVEGATKTDRVMAETPGVRPGKFMRFGPTFVALEDANGNLLGTWGALPLSPDGTAPSERRTFSGGYSSETPSAPPLDRALHKTFSQASSYAELRAGFALNPTRAAARLAHSSATAARTAQISPARTTIRLLVGETLETATERAFAKVRVDVDDESPAVEIRAQPRGFRVVGIHPGTELILAQDTGGALTRYSVVVASPGFLAKSTPQDACDNTVVSYWGAGTGWSGDQRQYRQLRSPDWCPVVGCGPTALLMLLGWWDANGVPSAFYQLRHGIGQTDHDFRFAFGGLGTSDAPRMIPKGEMTTVNGLPQYVPTPEEIVTRPVAADLYQLCNTFCISGQGVTQPGDLVNGARTYLDRVARDLDAPQDEYGETFVGAEIQHGFTDWYWAGGTDWETAGLLVANAIKAGRPGIVGLGDTLFDLHYAVAYAYKRIDTYEGCGPQRELIDRRRWFKCNMGWGATHHPEYHDAEGVWFGLTMKLWQKQMPHPN